MTGTILTPATAASVARVEVIDSVRHPAATRIADVLRSRSSRPRTLLIDDEENIVAAIAAGIRVFAIYATSDWFEAARQLQHDAAALYVVDEEVVQWAFRGDKRSRVFALARAPRPSTWRDLAAADGDVLVLDGLRIAGNIGAIVRSACAFDAAGVVLIDSDLVSVFDRRLIRASRGLVFTIPVLAATRPGLEAFLRSERMPLVSLTAEADAPLSAISHVEGRIAILMGSERAGASPDLAGRAERRCRVPMAPGVESLNVSVAAGIALYERRRR